MIGEWGFVGFVGGWEEGKGLVYGEYGVDGAGKDAEVLGDGKVAESVVNQAFRRADMHTNTSETPPGINLSARGLTGQTNTSGRPSF